MTITLKDKMVAVLTGKVTDADISDMKTDDAYCFWTSALHAGNGIVNTSLSAELVFYWLERITKLLPVEDKLIVKLGRKFPGYASRYLGIVRERQIPVASGCIRWLRKEIQAKRCLLEIVPGGATAAYELFRCLGPDATRDEFQYLCSKLPTDPRDKHKQFPVNQIQELPAVCYPWIKYDLGWDKNIIQAVILSKVPAYETKAEALCSALRDSHYDHSIELQSSFVIPDSVLGNDFLTLLMALSLVKSGKHHIKNLPSEADIKICMLQVLLSNDKKAKEIVVWTRNVRNELARSIGRVKSAKKISFIKKKAAVLKKAA